MRWQFENSENVQIGTLPLSQLHRRSPAISQGYRGGLYYVKIQDPSGPRIGLSKVSTRTREVLESRHLSNTRPAFQNRTRHCAWSSSRDMLWRYMTWPSVVTESQTVQVVSSTWPIFSSWAQPDRDTSISKSAPHCRCRISQESMRTEGTSKVISEFLQVSDNIITYSCFLFLGRTAGLELYSLRLHP